MAERTAKNAATAANLGFAAQLWVAADALRNNMDAADRNDAQLGRGDAFHPHLKADYVLANPPFNDSDWPVELLKNYQRSAFGTSPAGKGLSGAISVHNR